MLYAESSAVLAWLLAEPRGEQTRQILRSAAVAVSDLTMIECERTLRRVARLDGARAIAVEAGLRQLAGTASSWIIEAISPAVVDRARQPFPDDAIRSLDAIHLATALVLRANAADLEVLSLDDRIRGNARALGFRVLPA